MKTFVLSKNTHITAVLLTPSPNKCKVFDDLIHDFIRGNCTVPTIPNLLSAIMELLFMVGLCMGQNHKLLNFSIKKANL